MKDAKEIRAALAEARTLLFVPGNRPDRFDKAAASGADAVVLDLEDAVPPAQKPAAREAVKAAWERLAELPLPIVVRVNAMASGDELVHDLRALSGLKPPAAVMLPKAERGEHVGRVLTVLPEAPIVPLIETAAALQGLDGVASAEGVVRLAIGHLDFMADTGMSWSEGEPELAPLRFAVSVATRIAHLAPAVDGVTVQTDDEPRLRDDVLRAKRFGFGGKLCIHPKQVAVVHAALAPSEEEVAWARRVVEADAAAGGNAVKVDGRMVDAPVVATARHILARAAR
jgi:citrate lyase subunit beta/citryl-CoA lyase